LDQILSDMGDAVCLKVRAHNGNVHNEKADVLAGMASQQSFFVRHRALPPPSSTIWGIGAPGEPLPSWRRAIEDLAAAARCARERERAEKRRRKPISLGRMTDWFTGVRTGETIRVTWAYEGSQDTTVSTGVVKYIRRKRGVEYADIEGIQPFPPIAGVDVYVMEVVHPGTSPPQHQPG
jgi:hypothetical protein